MQVFEAKKAQSNLLAFLNKVKSITSFKLKKGDSVKRFRFFHELSSAKPLKITVWSFRFLKKMLGDIRKSRCTTDISDSGGKFATVVDIRNPVYQSRFILRV
jgi:hypothetical protein